MHLRLAWNLLYHQGWALTQDPPTSGWSAAILRVCHHTLCLEPLNHSAKLLGEANWFCDSVLGKWSNLWMWVRCSHGIFPMCEALSSPLQLFQHVLSGVSHDTAAFSISDVQMEWEEVEEIPPDHQTANASSLPPSAASASLSSLSPSTLSTDALSKVS